MSAVICALQITDYVAVAVVNAFTQPVIIMKQCMKMLRFQRVLSQQTGAAT